MHAIPFPRLWKRNFLCHWNAAYTDTASKQSHATNWHQEYCFSWGASVIFSLFCEDVKLTYEHICYPIRWKNPTVPARCSSQPCSPLLVSARNSSVLCSYQRQGCLKRKLHYLQAPQNLNYLSETIISSFLHRSACRDPFLQESFVGFTKNLRQTSKLLFTG